MYFWLAALVSVWLANDLLSVEFPPRYPGRIISPSPVPPALQITMGGTTLALVLTREGCITVGSQHETGYTQATGSLADPYQ